MTRNEIIQNADTYKTAQAIGIPMRQKGKNIQIICPGHEKHTGKRDGNFGSCVLTEHGYHCFAANCSASIVQMVQEQSEINNGRKMSQREALLFICEVNNFTLDDDNSNEKPFPFTLEELSLIGYKKPDKKEFQLAHFKPERYREKLYRTIQMDKEKTMIKIISLYEIWQQDSLECLSILEESCEKMLQKASRLVIETKENPLSLSYKISNQNQDLLMFYEKIKMYEKKLEKLKGKINYFKEKEKRDVSNN